MKRISGPRKAVNLSDSIHQQINMYALAAGAAGVGVVALARSAEAKIVYTPASVKSIPNHTVPLDLNHDGKKDFTFKNVLFTSSGATSFRSDRLSILPANANQIWGRKTSVGSDYASALLAGVKVGASGAFSAGPRSMAFGMDQGGSYYCQGKWNNVHKRFLGLKFSIHGKTHFGWARLKTTCDLYKVEAVLTGYAYETIPNKPIVTGRTKDADGNDEVPNASLTTPAPEPASLGALAMGAPGLSIWRREQPMLGRQPALAERSCNVQREPPLALMGPISHRKQPQREYVVRPRNRWV
jgi:hypothetical protein